MRLGLSQTVLARSLGVHPVTVNKWEHGGKITRVVELAMWALIMFDERERAARRAQPAAAPGTEVE